MTPDPQAVLRAAFAAAVAEAQPANCVPRHLPALPAGRTVVVGAGKAAAGMALALDRHWPGALSGVVVTTHGQRIECPRIEVLEAGHPLPGAAGALAAQRLLQAVAGLGPDDLVIALLSGGGSALACAAPAGVALEDKRAITAALLRSGASIREINCVRRHLSAIKGGRLATACHPARLVTLAISDVPGDDAADIASGPTVADATTCADALAVLERHAIAVPGTLRTALEEGRHESVKPGDPRLARSEFRLVATPGRSLEAAARAARELGFAAHVLSDRLEGEAREVGAALATLARQVADGGHPLGAAPCLLLSGGETTVTVRGTGHGGRNVECLLGFGLALGVRAGIHALFADTDGVDGMEPVAGAYWHPDSLARAALLGRPPRQYLDANDAHSLFASLGDSFVTGPTGTNVNDFRAVLVLPGGGGMRHNP
jgi:hydroxypyruvate reductase